MFKFSKSFVGSAHQQLGDVLLEALVGVVITALIGTKLVQVEKQVIATSRDTKILQLAVGQLRDQLQTQGIQLCDKQISLTLTPQLHPVVQVHCGPPQLLTVRIAGHEQMVEAPPQISLVISAKELALTGQAPVKLSSR